MNYLKEELIIPIVIVSLILVYIFNKTRNHQFDFIKSTWFKVPTRINKLRFLLKMFGLILLLVSLLDFRGPEEKIDSSIPDQKTIVIIDSSASMLAEDVRPNRYQKSILMARHFIKKAFGHRVAVVLFSDTQKRLVPFTDDLDLLDARVAGLGDVKNYDGGSNVTQAIRESMGYFQVEKGTGRDVGGNILVFTDSEGHDDGIELELPEKVSLAIVGVGTLKGARIPKRDRYNTFRGYKKYEGKEVFTKLNENWLKSLNQKVKTYKYWIANSYSIPTEEILKFFNYNFDKKVNKGSATVRPVMAQYLILPGMLCLILSFLLYPLRSFGTTVLLIVCAFCVGNGSIKAEDEPEIKISDETKILLESHRKGELTKENKVRLAEELLRDGDFERANLLYDEIGSGLNYKARNNNAVSLLKGKKPGEALRKFSEIQYEVRDKAEVSPEFKKELRQNILLALKEKKKQDQQKKQKDKEDKENQKKKEGEGKGKGSSNKDSKEKKKSKKDKGDKNKSKDEKKDNDGPKKNGESGDKEKKQKKKSLSEKQKEIERKKKMVKVPGLIKQILSDDRNLQRKYIDTSTKKPQGREKKDW